MRNGRLFIQVASGAAIFKWRICLLRTRRVVGHDGPGAMLQNDPSLAADAHTYAAAPAVALQRPGYQLATIRAKQTAKGTRFAAAALHALLSFLNSSFW